MVLILKSMEKLRFSSALISLIEIQLFAGSWALVRGDFMERCEPRRPTPGSITGP